MPGLIARDKRRDIERALDLNGCALLTGARQVGKTRLARMLERDLGHAAIYRDMQSPKDYAEVEDFETFHSMHRGKLVIIDEAQCLPGLFPQLRALLDQSEGEDSRTRWLLLGSAATELTQLTSQLVGRIGRVELAGFQLGELAVDVRGLLTTDMADAVAGIVEKQGTGIDVFAIQQRLWLRGGYPKAYFADGVENSAVWRRDYLHSMLDPASIPQGIVKRPDMVVPVWQYLAINHGKPLVMQSMCERLKCRKDAAEDILSYLTNMRLIWALPGWHPNEGKRADQHPCYFISDSGLLHESWQVHSDDALAGHKHCGKSWEGFVLAAIRERWNMQASFFYYRDKDQNEVDMLIEFVSGRKWIIEVKLGEDTAPERGFHAIRRKLGPERSIVINCARESQGELKDGIQALTLADALRLELD